MDPQMQKFSTPDPGRENAPGTGLTVVKGKGVPLTPAQKAFNRLVKRIEGLRRNIQEETERLGGLMEFYQSVLHPLEVKIVAERKIFIRVLLTFLEPGRVKKGKSRDVLKKVIREQLDVLMEMEGGNLEPEFAELFQVVEGKTVEEARNEAFAEMRGEWEAELSADGIDVDLSGFRPDMPPAEAAARLEELQQQLEAGRREGEAARPKTRKQLAAEERERQAEEVRQKDLGTLYRQLAKLLHPDLEADPALRAEKEVAMKRLTTAYKANDLHELLKLELEWVAREQADASRLTDAKLRIYNDVLKEQVKELEAALSEVAMHPRFAPLRQYVDPLSLMGGTFLIDRREAHTGLKDELAELTADVKTLAGPQPQTRLHQLLDEFRRFEREAPFGF